MAVGDSCGLTKRGPSMDLIIVHAGDSYMVKRVKSFMDLRLIRFKLAKITLH